MLKYIRVYWTPGQYHQQVKTKPYLFRDNRCIGRPCWQPEERTIPHGTADIVGLLGSSMRTKDKKHLCCGYRFDNGCPEEKDLEFNPELQRQRIEAGWRSSI
jgi:hypothetical protein